MENSDADTNMDAARAGTQRVRIDQLVLDPRCQMRVEPNDEAVAEYAEIYSDPEWRSQMPPVVAFQEWATEPYYIADGFLRCQAARAAGLDELDVEVHVGGLLDAILYACGANACHGMRRSNADKRRAVRRLLTNPVWRHWSDWEIARHCHVSNHLVADVRRTLTPFSPSEDSQRERTYVTKHGGSATMRTAQIGKTPTRVRSAKIAASTDPAILEVRARLEALRAIPRGARLHDLRGQDQLPCNVDDLGLTLPARAAPAFQLQHVFDLVARELNAIVERCRILHDEPPRAGKYLHLESIVTHVEQLKRAILLGQPSRVCPSCHANGNECRACLGRGFISKRTAELYPSPQVANSRVEWSPPPGGQRLASDSLPPAAS